MLKRFKHTEKNLQLHMAVAQAGTSVYAKANFSIIPERSFTLGQLSVYLYCESKAKSSDDHIF